MIQQVKAMVYSQKYSKAIKVGLRVEVHRIKEGPLSNYWTESDNGDLVIDKFFSHRMLLRDSVRATMRLETQTSPLEMKFFQNPHKCFPTARFNDQPVSDFLETHRTIVLMMESPHKDEYEENGANHLRPIAPANGQAGERIFNHGKSVFGHLPLCQNEDYCVVLCNPIPFQCSLWHLIRQSDDEGLDRRIRSNVWRDIWNCPDLGYPERLVCRVARYKPIFAINACTSGLKGRIRTLLGRYYPSLSRWETVHPSVWNDKTQLIRIE